MRKVAGGTTGGADIIARILRKKKQIELGQTIFAVDVLVLSLFASLISPADIQERYFQGRADGYYALEHAHIAWAVVE